MALYGFDWRRLALRMGDMDWHIHYYIYLMSSRGDKLIVSKRVKCRRVDELIAWLAITTTKLANTDRSDFHGLLFKTKTLKNHL